MAWQAALPLHRADGLCTAPGVSLSNCVARAGAWIRQAAAGRGGAGSTGLLPSALPAMPPGLGTEKQSIFACGEMKQSSYFAVIIFIGSG